MKELPAVPLEIFSRLDDANREATPENVVKEIKHYLEVVSQEGLTTPGGLNYNDYDVQQANLCQEWLAAYSEST